MDNVLYKVFTPEVKKIDDNSYRVTITTGIQDRQGQVIKSDGAQTANYMRNPVVLWAHQYTTLPVGKTTNIAPGQNAVDADFQFAPPGVNAFADEVHRAWDAGLLNAVSVGIIPLEWEDAKTVKTWELLEFSIVPIPANQEALRRMLEANHPEVEEKEGRVLSKKNRLLITDTATQLKACLRSLQALLRATEPAAQDDEPDNTDDNEQANADGGKAAEDKREKLLAIEREIQKMMEALK